MCAWPYSGEVTKFLLAGTMLVATGQASSALVGWSFGDAVRLAGAPALVYTVQNVCIQIAYANLDGYETLFVGGMLLRVRRRLRAGD